MSDSTPVLTNSDFWTIIEKMIADGYSVHNRGIGGWKGLRADILDCDWTRWFALTEENREYGGVMIFDPSLTAVNPVMTRGCSGSVELTDYCTRDTYVITIHSHGGCDSPHGAPPSRADWYAGANRGWHLVVTYWGIFAHFAAGKQKGIVRWEQQAIKFIPRSEIDGSTIGANLKWNEADCGFDAKWSE